MNSPTSRRFNWNDLQYVLAVARTGTLSGAARSLGSDHATVSRRVRNIEEALGIELFHRSAAGYMLTARGKQFFPKAVAAEWAVEQAAGGTMAERSTLAGSIRITAPEGFASHFLAARLGRFARCHPGLVLEVLPIPQILALSPREGDITLSLSPRARGAESELLAEYGLGLYRGAAAPDAARSVEDLPGQPFIGYVQPLIFTPELDYLAEVHPAIVAQLQVSSLVDQVTLTRRGDGLCVLPHFMARQYADLAPVLPDAVHLRRSYWMSIRPDLAERPAIRAFADFVRAEVQAADW